jgi:small subunit ribosomal protein S17
MPKKRVQGTVVSEKMDKTIVVRVNEIRQHPIYEKRFVRSKKFYAHDPEGDAHVGDEVAIEETRPMSKTKRWILVEVINQAKIS